MESGFDETELMAELERLERSEEITTEDLEDLRRSLPTDPPTARLVQKALWYPWSELFEFVEGSDRQRAYWRTKPERAGFRSDADLRSKKDFARAAQEATGLEGTVERDGRRSRPARPHRRVGLDNRALLSRGLYVRRDRPQSAQVDPEWVSGKLSHRISISELTLI